MVFVKHMKFFLFLFLAKSDRKICLTILWKEKKAFLDSEIKKLKRSKNQDFLVLAKILKLFHVLYLVKSASKMCLTFSGK